MEKRLTNKILKKNLEIHILESEIAFSYMLRKREAYERGSDVDPFQVFTYNEIITKLDRPLCVMKNAMQLDLEDDKNYSNTFSYICMSMSERGNNEFKANDFKSYRDSYIRENKIESILNDI
jgi:hypothetical protein